MSKFYFTYGSDCEYYPFNGGWTEVIANDVDGAISAFNSVHPNDDGPVRCAGIYREEEFKKTTMYEKKSNFGYGCRERISLSVEEL